MKPPDIPLEKILALEPACLRMTVPETYRDENGHMNVRWYAMIFDEASDTLHERLGLTPKFHKANGTGTMDLENHFSYLHEVMAVTVWRSLRGSWPVRPNACTTSCSWSTKPGAVYPPSSNVSTLSSISSCERPRPFLRRPRPR